MPTNTKGDNVTKTISLRPKLYKDADKRKDALGIASFSQYVQLLIVADLKKRGALSYEEEGKISDGTMTPKEIEQALKRLKERAK